MKIQCAGKKSNAIQPLEAELDITELASCNTCSTATSPSDLCVQKLKWLNHRQQNNCILLLLRSRIRDLLGAAAVLPPLLRVRTPIVAITVGETNLLHSTPSSPLVPTAHFCFTIVFARILLCI